MQSELNKELIRYYALISVFEKTIFEIDSEMKNSDKWFIFCSKIGRKFLIHLKSLVLNAIQGIANIEIDDINVTEELDISLLNANIRLQLDTYATFYHIFIHDGDWAEKIIRFRLWQMDALISRQKFTHDRLPEAEQQIADEKQQIQDCFSIIEGFDFFKNLSDSQKNRLVKKDGRNFSYANWRFDTSLLSGKKTQFSWKDLTLNTGIKSEIYSDMHNFTSMHVHSNYISILQNEGLSIEDQHDSRMVALRLSSYLTCLFLDDLCNRFLSAKEVAKSLSADELDLIKTLLRHGRKAEMIKHFL